MSPTTAFVNALNALAASLRRSHFDLAPLLKQVKRNRWWRTWTDAFGVVQTHHSFARWCTNVLSCDSGTANKWIAAYDGLLSYGIRRGSARFRRAVGLGFTRVVLMQQLAGTDRAQFLHLLTTGPSATVIEQMLGRQPPRAAVVDSSVFYVVRRLRVRGPVNYDYLRQGGHRVFTVQPWLARQFPSPDAALNFVQSWRRQGRSGQLEASSITLEIRPLGR